jgi:hypothetical protein
MGVANTLWAYARMGREPGAGMMRVLEGRAEAVAGTLKVQVVAITLWTACVFSIFRAHQAVAERLVSLDPTGSGTGVRGQASASSI